MADRGNATNPMRALKLLKYVIMFVGLGLLVGGINDVLESGAFIGKAESAEGTVIRVEPFKYSSDKVSTTRYRPVIRFSARDGRSTEVPGSPTTVSWAYQVGEKVPVWYHPANPRDAIQGGFRALWLSPAIVIAIGGLISLIYAVVYAVKAYEKGLAIYLRRFGEPVRTTFVSARPNPLVFLNNVHPFNIVSKWRNPLTGRTHEFTSPDLWFDLEGYVPAGEITVYMMPDNPGTYCMDRSFLTAKKPPPMKDPFPTQTDTDEAGDWNISLGTAVRSHWPYLLGAPLFGPYVFVLTPVFQLPFGLTPFIFLVSLGLAMLPVGMRKAPMSFFALALGLFAAGIAICAVLAYA